MIQFNLAPFIVLIELLAAEGTLLFYQEKRKLFPLRLLLSLIPLAILNLCWGFFSPTFDNLAYALQFMLTVFGICFCYKLKFLSALYWGTAGLTIQHFVFSLTSLIGMAIPRFYDSLVFLAVMLIIVLVFEFVFITRRLGQDFELKENHVKLTVISLIAMMTATFLNSYRMNYLADTNLILITSIYSVICCLLALTLQLGLFQKTQMEQEVQVLEQIIANDKQHYDSAMQNMEMLNMYCHDLKYFLRRNADEVGTYQQQAEKFLAVFDAEISTCNHALDIVLSEKSLYCANNDIMFTCMADGQLLDYMDTADIYSLFGNLLSNAIEAVSALSEKEKRMISLTVRRRNDFVHILTENYYDKDLSFHNGLPETTKDDSHLHGYGLKSIRYLTEKYHGNMTVTAEDGIFHVNILLPISN